MYTKDHLGYKKRIKKKSKRPIPLTVICVLLVLWGLFNLVSMYIRVYQGIHTIYPAINALMIVFLFVSVSGIWSMEKWGPITFPIVVLLKIIVDLIFGFYSSWYLLGFVLSIYFLRFYTKMRHTE
jgi:hypothetical protein